MIRFEPYDEYEHDYTVSPNQTASMWIHSVQRVFWFAFFFCSINHGSSLQDVPCAGSNCSSSGGVIGFKPRHAASLRRCVHPDDRETSVEWICVACKQSTIWRTPYQWAQQGMDVCSLCIKTGKTTNGPKV